MAGHLPAGTRPRPVPLTGRHQELTEFADLLAGVREGAGSALVLVGEAGVGKTRLLDHVAQTSADLRVVRAAGVESEARLDFAALHCLLHPFLGGLDALPAPQRSALASAFGLSAGPAADRYLVGVAALALLAGAAPERPLLCLVDDAQWIDPESRATLAFVGRRLADDAVGLVVSGRGDLLATDAFDGFPDLPIRGLAEADAHELLRRNVAGRLDPAVAARIVAQTGGNPLALIESVRALSPAHLAGTAPLPEPIPVGALLESHFAGLLEELPDQTRALLTLMAAAPEVDTVLIWRAAAELGIPAGAVDAGVSAGLLTLGPGIAFRHPLISSAVLRGADAAERRRVHAALAAVSDPVRSAERRAWHRAEATGGVDDEVAAELDAASGREAVAGGYPRRAAFLSRAAELAVADRPVRLAKAARARLILGDPAAARSLLDQAEPLLGAGDPVARARVLHARATVDLFSGRAGGTLAPLLAAADTVAGTAPALARSMLAEALAAELSGGGGAATLRKFGRAVLASPALRTAAAPTGVDLLLRGFALRGENGYPAAVPVLQAGLTVLALGGGGVHGDYGDPEDAEHSVRPALLACHAAHEIWDDARGEETAGLVEARERRAGALGALRLTLLARSVWEVCAGRLAAAEACLDEAEDLPAAIGEPSPVPAHRVEVLAWRGREEARAAAEEIVRAGETAPANAGLGDWARSSVAVLELALGRHAEAAALLGPAFDQDGVGVTARVLPDLVEASAGCGDHRTAREVLRRLEDRASLAGTPWALGLLARCRALTADDEHAEASFAESVALLGRTRIRTDLARTHLLYGEWLRRRHRLGDAAPELRTAYQMFEDMGAAAFAERARVELLATGERTRKRASDAERDLTPQERRIAELVVAGATNAEIAARLFITQSTVEYHLKKVFRKAGITSRRQVVAALGEAG
jgi:DNA-binding CsgD family transcriptional regulator